MTIAFWCVLAMILLPYVFTVIAKWSSYYDNRNPRDYLAHTTGWRRRANCVQLNFFEATPAFGLAIIIASLAHAPQARVDAIAGAYVLCRILYSICYLTDKASLRTFFWMLGFVAVIAIFVVAAIG
jgi:uncharacterized MAPEG superfamily protein